MTIWLLAILLLASLAALGYRQGAIRVAFSLLGILIGALLASPLARAAKPLLVPFGVKSPLLLWLLPPVIIFLVVLTLFKIAGYAVHHKVEVYYKYKAGDLRLALWERLNRRLGLCLGLANGTAYLVLASLPIFLLSYWTAQMATPDSDPKTLRLVNRLGSDLQNTGLSKVAAAVDKTPDYYYQAADIVGLIYHTPLLEGRLSRYPAFLNLGERPEFQDIANDTQFENLRLKQASALELMQYPKVQAMLDNPDLVKTVWDTLIPNLPDLRAYLETGKSSKYDAEPILGRWDFDVAGTILLLRKNNPKISSNDMKRYRGWIAQSFSKTTLVAGTDGQAFLKGFPSLQAGTAAADLQNLQGQWKSNGGKYSLTFTIGGKTEEMTGDVQGDRMTLGGSTLGMMFERED